MRYPEARRLDLVEELHGRRVADPYRWLEDATAPETVAWSKAQDELWREFASSHLANRDRVARRLQELTPGYLGPPAVRGDRMFFARRLPEQDLVTYCVREPDGAERVLVDPMELDPAGTTTLESVEVSIEGGRLGFVVSEAGTEQSVLRVIDVDSGELLEGPLELGRGGGFTWLRGGERYAMIRRLDEVPPGEEQLHRRVWIHRLGTPVAEDEMLFGEGRDPRTYYGLSASPTSDHLLIGAWIGTERRNDVYVFDLGGADSAVRSVVHEGEDAESWGVVRDEKVYLRTDLHAPRGRLCVAAAAEPSVDRWQELVAEGDDVLQEFEVTDQHLIAVRMRDVVSVVVVHDRQSGAELGEVDLPGLGVAGVVAPPLGGDRVWITYTDYLTPNRVLLHDLPARTTTRWADAPGAPELRGIDVQQVFAVSADGTRVPMFVLAPTGRSGPLPTIVTGYGGFQVPYSPAYTPQAIAWVEAGGVFAITNLRGGAEYGEEWHRAGMREHKQNVFDDLFACARWLVENGFTTAAQLGISGGSNGGLLVGAALTQRPELFRSVVCSAPLLDMVRYEQFGLGATWNDEYGRADDPTELGWLLSYSPYHHVVEGTEYPAVLFTVFENDTRVDPLHARKMCAALQHASSAPPEERPVLLRREGDVGHGGRSVSRSVELSADTISFHASQLGLPLS